MCETQGVREGIEDREGQIYVARKQMITIDVAGHGTKRKNKIICVGVQAKVTSIAN